MAKRKSRSVKNQEQAIPPDQVIVAWEEDPNSEEGGFWCIIDSINRAEDGQVIGVYDLARLGKAKRSTELV